MMYASLLFWIALALPGFFIVRRFFEYELKSGLLGVVALSYLGSFALLAAVVIPLYVLKAPLGVFSGAVLLAMLAAAVEMTRRGWWRDIWALLKESRGLPLALLCFVLVLDLRTGAFLGGDAVVHLSRIRFLVDHGLSNRDPFVAGDFFFPIYHTNLLHALYASATQLTGMNHLDVWYASIPWAKLLVVSGVFYLAWTIFEVRWIAWTAAVFCLVARGPVTFAIYPNQLAPYWLLPMVIAFAIRACDQAVRPRDVLRIGATTVVIGSLHGLYAAFAVMAAGPILAWGVARHVKQRSGRAMAMGACLVALAAGLPFGLVSKLKTPPVMEKHLVYDVTPEPSGDYVQTATGGWMRRVGTLPMFLGGSIAGTVVFALALACAAVGSREIRRRAMMLASVPIIAALLLYVPPLCTLMMSVFGEEWVVSRYEIVTSLAFFAIVPTAIAAIMERWRSGVVMRGLVCAAVVLGAYFHTRFEPPWTWSEAVRSAMKPTEEREQNLRDLQRIGELARVNMPRGAVVLSEPMASLWFTMVFDCRIIASASASNGVPELDRRLKDLSDMLKAGTDWPTRRELLRKYNVEYFIPTTGSAAEWVRPHIASITQTSELTFIRLKLQ